MMTPKDHMSQDLSYFSGPSTSGAANQRSTNMSGPGPRNTVTYPNFSVNVPIPTLGTIMMGR